MQEGAHVDHAHDAEFKCEIDVSDSRLTDCQDIKENINKMARAGQNPRYLQKLGII